MIATVPTTSFVARHFVDHTVSKPKVCLKILCFVSEMKPRWFPVDSIPYDKMWPDDKLWFPLFLKGSKFSGYFKFQGHNNILEHKLEELEIIPG